MRQIAILCACIGLVSFVGIPAGAAVINVPADHATIQLAVSAATGVDTVVVAAGLYTEDVTVVAGKDGLTIEGANAGIAAGRVPGVRGAESIVDGGFQLSSASVTVDGFQVINGNTSFGAVGAIYMPSPSATDIIKNNIFVGDGSACLYP
ncbi:MAG: hypothetical protein GY720_23280, partial [bacterium]|nr:hypothetical protein [bacterium]